MTRNRVLVACSNTHCTIDVDYKKTVFQNRVSMQLDSDVFVVVEQFAFQAREKKNQVYLSRVSF